MQSPDLVDRGGASRSAREWYKQHIQGRALWVTLESAEYWFLMSGPVEVSRSELIETPDWIGGVRPFYTPELLESWRLVLDQNSNYLC